MFKRKKKQKLKNYKAYFHPYRIHFLLTGLGGVIFGFGQGISYASETITALVHGENSKVILSGMFSSLAVFTFFVFMGWISLQVSKIHVIMTEKGIKFQGIGVTISAKWGDVERVEWDRGGLIRHQRLSLIASQVTKRRTWWSIGDHDDNVPLTHLLSNRQAYALEQGQSLPLLEDILRYAPHVQMVATGKQSHKNGRWTVG
jgi:hypothetical protein